MLALALCACGPLAAQTSVQTYPSKTVHVVVPTSPGGATDVVARIAAAKLGAAFGQSFVVENRIGAFGTLGAESVAKSAPDGYTLLVAFDNFTSNPYLFKSAVAHPIKDFAPIALLVRSPQVLVVRPGFGATHYEDFARIAKTMGTRLNYGTAGPGTSSRLTVELLKVVAGIDPTAVHYKGGNPAMAALLGGQVDMMIVVMGTAMENLRAGKLVPLAVTSATRSAIFPDVPTLAEFYPGFEAQAWVGLLAPAGTSRDIVTRLSGGTRKALSTPDSLEKLRALGYELVGSSPEDFGELLRSESAKWERIIRERGITLD
jgi:tripartite-type tricarboxylate transporter receptor subunit TctC